MECDSLKTFCTSLCAILQCVWSLKVNYRFRQIHGAPTKILENCSIVIFARGVPPKLYFFMADYRKSTGLAEILTFYFRLFSQYYTTEFSSTAQFRQRKKCTFLQKIISEIHACAPFLYFKFSSFCDSQFFLWLEIYLGIYSIAKRALASNASHGNNIANSPVTLTSRFKFSFPFLTFDFPPQVIWRILEFILS